MGLSLNPGTIFGLAPGSGDPELTKAPTDAYTQNAFQEQKSVAGQTPAEFAADNVLKSTQGITEPRSLLTGGAVPGGQAGMSEALQRRQNRQFDSATNIAGRTAEANAPTKQAEALQQGLATAHGDMAANIAFLQEQQTARLNQETQRNNAISSLLGGVGSIAGAAMAKKPGGGGKPGGGAAGGFAGSDTSTNFMVG